MNYNKYLWWCRLCGSEILSKLSEGDKDWLQDLSTKLDPNAFYKLQKKFHPDVLHYLRLTPAQRLKVKKFHKHPDRLLITFFALYYLHYSHYLMGKLENIPDGGPYRDVIADLADLYLELRTEKFLVYLEKDSFDSQ